LTTVQNLVQSCRNNTQSKTSDCQYNKQIKVRCDCVISVQIYDEMSYVDSNLKSLRKQCDDLVIEQRERQGEIAQFEVRALKRNKCTRCGAAS